MNIFVILIGAFLLITSPFNLSSASDINHQSIHSDNLNTPETKLIKKLYAQGSWGKIFELIEDPNINLNFNIKNNKSFLADIIERKNYKILNQVIRYHYNNINTDVRLSDGNTPLLHFLNSDKKNYIDFFINSPTVNFKSVDSEWA